MDIEHRDEQKQPKLILHLCIQQIIIMKLVKRNISAKDGSGSIILCPNTPEDLWHAYNLLQKGDCVRCTTVRKVVKESFSTGSTTSSKKRLMLTVQIKKVEFDPDSLEVRLSGKVQSENDFVRMGAHHTLTLELKYELSVVDLLIDLFDDSFFCIS